MNDDGSEELCVYLMNILSEESQACGSDHQLTEFANTQLLHT